MFIVIPIYCDSMVQDTIPALSDGVDLLNIRNQLISMLFAKLFDAEVIKHQVE